MRLRRLVVCFDGTWNTPDKGENVTNVVRLLRAIPARDGDGVSQFVFYDKGVGTGNLLDRLAGGAFGTGLDENVVDGYRFLANNYAEGDEIYLFGFSRGAYTARSLAGLIGLAGLLRPTHLGSDLERVLAIYRDDDLDRAGRLAAIDRLSIARIPAVPIACLGVWDTVGALGIPGNPRLTIVRSRKNFHDVQLNPRIEVALHAIAIDEKRKPFEPTLWEHGDEPAPANQTVEQVWFPGVHSNVGGSYTDCGLSDIALDWMIKRVGALAGLRFDESYLEASLRPDVAAKGVESRTTLYMLDRLRPLVRPIGDKAGRTVREMLHVAALERWALPAVQHDCPEDRDCRPVPYRPANLQAAIAERGLPVVGWDGEVMPPHEVPWPLPAGGPSGMPIDARPARAPGPAG